MAAGDVLVLGGYKSTPRSVKRLRKGVRSVDEIALLYFQQLEKKLRSSCSLIAETVECVDERVKDGRTVYLYRALFKCKKTFKVRKVEIDNLGRVVSDP
jgi:hypothetical protein